MTLFYSLLTPADTLSHSESSLITAADKKKKKKSRYMQAFNEPSRSKFKYTTDLHLLLHQDTNFKYTQWVPCSSVQCMIHLFTVSLRACPNWTNDKEKKEPNPHVRKNKVQLSETLQHWETRCNRQRRNNYDQCSLQLHIAIMDKKKLKKRSLTIVIISVCKTELNKSNIDNKERNSKVKCKFLWKLE